MTIRREDFGGGPPALTAELLNLDAGDITVLTIEAVETDVKVPQPGQAEARRVLVLRFKERPDHAYYCNKTSVGRLIDAIGDNEKAWLGKKVPLIATDQQNPNSGEMGVSLWVCDPKTWGKHVKGFARAASKR